MDQICLALPVLMGRTDRARRLMQELDGARGIEHDRFERRLGIQKAVWYLAGNPLGELLIAYLELEDFRRSFALLSRSREDFDLWFNAGIRDATGIDLTAGERISLPELLCSWRVDQPRQEGQTQ